MVKILLVTVLGVCFVARTMGWMLNYEGNRHSRCISLTTKVSEPRLSTSRLHSSKVDSTAVPSTTIPSQDQREQVWNRLVDHFQGDFDNYHQVVHDRQQGMEPREGGGHEQFHCTLIPVSKTGRLAAFYFDGNPTRIFRFRYYHILYQNETNPAGDSSEASSTTNDNSNDNDSIEMKLYLLHPELEAQLRACSEEPVTEWPQVFHDFPDSDDKLAYLKDCEISWSLTLDPIQHDYIQKQNEDDENGLHAVLVHGQAIVDSTMVPGIQIRILDQLSLYPDVFYINDRGFHLETGEYVYGNQRGIPYRLERVARLQPSTEDDSFLHQERQVVNDELKWTMGPQWRTADEYDSKMAVIGGPSVMRPPTPKDN